MLKTRKPTKTLALILSLVAIVSCFTITAFAATQSSHTYAISLTTDADGAWVGMDASDGNRIEYTGIAANCSISSATATVELYQSSFPVNTWKPSNQTITMGSGKRAYWLNCPNSTYSIHAIANGNTTGGGVRASMTLNGTFRNY